MISRSQDARVGGYALSAVFPVVQPCWVADGSACTALRHVYRKLKFSSVDNRLLVIVVAMLTC